MADKKPVKPVPDVGSMSGLKEFEPGDSIGVVDGGTGATTSPNALINLGAVSTITHDSHADSTVNPHSVTATQTGAIPTTEKAVANGVATLDGNGILTAAQRPTRPGVTVVADATARIAQTVLEGHETKQLSDNSWWIYDGSVWILTDDGHTAGSGSVFGTEQYTLKDPTVATTTDTNYQLRATLNIPIVPAGNYRASWRYYYNHNKTNSDFLARVLLDGVVILHDIRVEPKDSSGSFGSTGSNQKILVCDFEPGLVLTNAAHTLELFYATSDDDDESSVWGVTLDIFRES